MTKLWKAQHVATSYIYVVLILPMIDTALPPDRTGFTPSTDVDEVFAYLSGTLNRLEQMFIEGCARTAEHFAARKWKRFDPNLYAHEVRKEVFEALLQGGLAVELEDSDPLKVESMSLCGLLLKRELIHLRVRKSKNGEVPRADTGNLVEFYQANLFPTLAVAGEIFPLNLMLLWDVDASKQFKRFWLGCPKEDGVHWYWSKSIPLGGLVPVEAVDHGKAFREAFEAENSDVPMTRVEGEPEKRSTGTDEKTGK
jgi:hypothetical protein